MNSVTSLFVATLCMSAVYCATYEQPRESGAVQAEQPADGPPEPSLEELMGPSDPVPQNNETLTAIHHGGQVRAVGPAAPLATSDKAVQTLIAAEVNLMRKISPATNMLKVSWDSDIQAAAQRWADNCVFNHPSSSAEKVTFLKTAKFGLGQNIAMGTGSMSWNTALKMWYDEVKDFKLGSAPSNGAVVGHYTALVWSSTSAVGCGYKLCPAGKMTSQPAHFFVCNFGPAGNIAPNQYKPYEAGTKCGKCASACEDGLCTKACPYTNDYSNCEVSAGMAALFPSGCANAPAHLASFKDKCKATCQCKDQGLLYSV